MLTCLQNAYRQNHSTETTLIKVKNAYDLLMNMDKGHVKLLVLLDLSAAFDTVDRGILLRGLTTWANVEMRFPGFNIFFFFFNFYFQLQGTYLQYLLTNNV